ncbi:alpha/beta hydrolase [Paracoccus shanxieyensis]|uniref:Alpha/beta hydrolase n=1 Tax=Paracoccus shanxieyensis TaxID=2675752 RepID=A0A6L6IT00_9RHOB|nr:alpha/beta hydrolase-fold protein [Paracoccus shanxieyensis]MTH62979.1 alpha/beta hydrolase [Paracoccus shanxieyensis]MTH85937.1 alpha/beta hydrolase [Paracoccus shanxieyensis]
MSASQSREHGRVGPEHARMTAELRIFDTGAPTHQLSQKVVQAGPGYRLFIAVPKGPAPDAGWPVVYMLDGNAVFDFLTVEDLAMAKGLVVVGVGYDTPRQFARELRTQDFTAPDGPGDGLRPDHVHEGRVAGGAAIFHDRLTGPLRAAAEDGLNIDPARRTLWGHSFGGLFTLYALLARPLAFARHAAISPSIWWDEPLMRRVAAKAARADLPLLMALGDREKRSGSDGPPPDGPAPATMQFIADLALHPGHRAQVHVLPGHVHIQTLAGSFPLIFPFALNEI